MLYRDVVRGGWVGFISSKIWIFRKNWSTEIHIEIDYDQPIQIWKPNDIFALKWQTSERRRKWCHSYQCNWSIKRRHNKIHKWLLLLHLGAPGGSCPPPPPFLSDQSTLFKSGGGQIIPTTLLLTNPRVLGLPPPLYITSYHSYRRQFNFSRQLSLPHVHEKWINSFFS